MGKYIEANAIIDLLWWPDKFQSHESAFKIVTLHRLEAMIWVWSSMIGQIVVTLDRDGLLLSLLDPWTLDSMQRLLSVGFDSILSTLTQISFVVTKNARWASASVSINHLFWIHEISTRHCGILEDGQQKWTRNENYGLCLYILVRTFLVHLVLTFCSAMEYSEFEKKKT